MSSFQNDYVFTKIPNILFERLREEAGPFGPSVNQEVQKLIDVTQRRTEVWVVKVKPGLKNHLDDLKGVKVTPEQFDDLVRVQNRLKESNLFVPISDLICGRYLRVVCARMSSNSWAQLAKDAFPNQDMFIQIYVLKEDGELECVHGRR